MWLLQAMKPEGSRLVILTTHFGTNFSGGSTATCEIFSRLEDQFDRVTVIGTQLGNHPFRALEFIQYHSWWDAIRTIRRITGKGATFYGDFYNAFLLVLASVPFYFTCHDNWPEMAQFGFKNRINSFFYTSIYLLIFSRALHVFSVSNFKKAFISRATDRVSVVRNGYSKTERQVGERSNKVLMVGNIDQRKYKKALDLFLYMEKREGPLFHIDVYGSVNDQKLAAELSRFPFVNLMGFAAQVPYWNYKLLLHTSVMENLPISFCEALHHQLPVVAFDVGGASEIVGDKQGVLVQPYAVKELYERLMSLWHLKNMEAFHLEVPPEYSWETCSQQYLEKMNTPVNQS